MKKLLLFFVTMLMSVTATWADFTQGNFKFSVNSDDPATVSVSQASRDIGGDLVIPAQVTEANVTYIVTKVAYEGFNKNPNITSVVLPSTIKELGSSSFDESYNIASLALNEGLEIIGSYMVWAPSDHPNTSLTSITIPSTVKKMGSSCFTRCTALTTVTFAGSDEDLEISSGEIFPESPIETLNLDRNLKDFTSVITKNVKNVVIGNHVTSITNNAFSECANLESVTLGANIVSIGDRAFWKCAKLTDIAMGDKVITLGEYVFQYCELLANITFGANIETIGKDCLGFCKSLTHVDLPAKLTILEYDFFEQCTSLQSVTMPDNLTTIGNYAFYHCEALQSLTIPATVTQITGGSAFSNMNSMQTFTIEDSDVPLVWPNGYGTIDGTIIYIGRPLHNSSGEYFDYKIFDKAEEMTIGGGYTTVKKSFLYGHPYLRKLVLKDNVTTLEEAGVKNCQKLETVDLGGKITVIPYECFEKCYALTSVTLHEGLKEISHGAFYDCTALESIALPASLEKIGRGVFHRNEKLTSFTIADSDQALIFDNNHDSSTGGYSYGSDNLFYSGTLDEFYLGRDISITPTATTLVTQAKKITFGENVTAFGTMFETTAQVEEVKAPWVSPIAIGDNAFAAAAYSGAKLWVPGGTKDDYGTATGWKEFTNKDYWSYVVTLTASKNGKLSVGTNEASNGSTLFRLPLGEEFDATVTANTGYELTAFTDDDAAVTPLPTTTYHRANSTDAEFVALNATFTPIVYPITYDLAGGALAEGQENPATYTIESAAITLKNPTRRGYTFEGWTGTDLTEASKSVTIAAGSIGERSYTATWKIITYTLTYDLAGGSVATENPATYTVETESFTLTNPTKAGYTFAGWTGTDLTEATTTVTIAKGTIDNRSYTATWTPNPYKVHFNANNGTGEMADQNFVYDAAQALTANAFTRNGYTFNGWNTKADGTGTPYADKASVKNLTTEANATVNLYAQWQVITYTLTYDLAGGSVATANPTEYTIETAAFTLTNPTKDYYVFAGWTGTELSEATMSVTIPNGSTGNRSYTATWEKETYAVNLTSNNAALVTLSTAAPQYQDNVVVTIDNSTAAELVEFTVDGVNHLGDLDSDGKYTITNVQADVEVVVNFSSSTTVAVLEQEWATFVANKAVDFFGTGLTAYIVTGRNTAGTAVILEEVSTVPANTPVVLNGTTGSYTIPYVASSATDVSANLLKRGTGSAVNAGTGVSRYVLSAEGATAVFKKIGATPATVPTNKAYLEISESSSAPQLSIEIGGGTTGIFSISGISEQDEIYDMQGRKVEHVSKKGLYIINGKKVVIK